MRSLLLLSAVLLVSCINTINNGAIISLSVMKMNMLMKPRCSRCISPLTEKENYILWLNIKKLVLNITN